MTPDTHTGRKIGGLADTAVLLLAKCFMCFESVNDNDRMSTYGSSSNATIGHDLYDA